MITYWFVLTLFLPGGTLDKIIYKSRLKTRRPRDLDRIPAQLQRHIYQQASPRIMTRVPYLRNPRSYRRGWQAVVQCKEDDRITWDWRAMSNDREDT